MRKGIETITYGDSRASRMWNDVDLILPFHMFADMILSKETFLDLANWIEDYIEIRRRFCGNVCNQNVFIKYKDRYFSFLISKGSKAFYLWGDDDVCSIAQIKVNLLEIPTKQFISYIQEALDDYINNVIVCSDCGKKIKLSQIGGRYFAGVYCDKCWNDTWKEIEAKETYN